MRSPPMCSRRSACSSRVIASTRSFKGGRVTTSRGRPALNGPYAHLSEFVATRSETAPPDGVTFTADALATVRELKRREGLAIYLCGGGNLAGELLPEIDRLILKRNPVVLGDGVRLFGAAGAVVQNFDLVSCRSFESGVVIEEYVRTIR